MIMIIIIMTVITLQILLISQACCHLGVTQCLKNPNRSVSNTGPFTKKEVLSYLKCDVKLPKCWVLGVFFCVFVSLFVWVFCLFLCCCGCLLLFFCSLKKKMFYTKIIIFIIFYTKTFAAN